MRMLRQTTCPGCGARLPVLDGPSHRYIGASAACWALYSALQNAGEPPMSPGPLHALLVDAYAAQHPGTPSDQSIQSVAVHLLALYGVLHLGLEPAQAMWVRQRAVRKGAQPRHARFIWLEPPLARLGAVTVADIVAAPTPAARTEVAARYIRAVWAAWAAAHSDQVARWYTAFVRFDRL